MAGKIPIVARPVGVGGVLRRFIVAGERLEEDTLEAQRELGRRAEVAFAAHAPHRTGRLIRGIASIFLGGKVIVKDEAKNPATGFDYVRITRFGHAVARITAKHTGARSLATGKAKAGMLRFTISGRVMYRRSVAGYHPTSDWAEDALPEVRAEAQAVATRLGRKIEARF